MSEEKTTYSVRQTVTDKEARLIEENKEDFLNLFSRLLLEGIAEEMVRELNTASLVQSEFNRNSSGTVD